MVTKTCCDPEAGALCTALRCSEHDSAMMNWGEPTGSSLDLVLQCPLRIKKKFSWKKKNKKRHTCDKDKFRGKRPLNDHGVR